MSVGAPPQLSSPGAAQRPALRARPQRRGRAMHLAGWYGTAAGIALFVAGMAGHSAMLVSVAGAVAGIGLVLLDVSAARRGGVTPATVMAAAGAVAAFANAVALRNADTPSRPTYFLYAVDRYLFLATALQFAGGVLPVLGMYAALRHPMLRGLLAALPKVRGRLDDRWLVPVAVTLSLAALASHLVAPLAALGTLSAFFFQIPHLAAFTLARAGTQRRVPYALPAALGIAVLEAGRALVTAYLRVDIVSPIFAFALGALLGARSLAPLRSRYFIPIYAMTAAFLLTFGAFGEVREQASGMDRLNAVYAVQQRQLDAPVDPAYVVPRPRQTFLSRLTSVNQLSQIGRLVEEDGFLGGQTLEYLAYAFVPRFLWPSKPTIAKGAWFALRIGQARVLPDGRVSNAVNMSVPGELYLNFGWPGVVVGCFIFGTFVGALWLTTSFWGDPRNLLGSAFGYYLLFSGINVGSDLQFLVTAVAMYLIFVALSAVHVGAPRARRPAALPPAARNGAAR